MEIWQTGQEPYDWKSDPDMLVPGDTIDLDMCDDTLVFTPARLNELHRDLRMLRIARNAPIGDEAEWDNLIGSAR